MASPDDYAWTATADLQPYLCVSMVRGIGAAELLDRLEAIHRGGPVTAQQLWQQSGDFDPADRRALTGVKDLDGGWTLWLEPSSFKAPWSGDLSAGGGRVVVIETNPKGGGDFVWYENGDLRLRFEPAFASDRDGSDPDALYDEMQRLGFEVELSDDDDYRVGPVDQAAYALMEHLTGVRLTPESVRDGYLTGVIVLPY